MSIWSIFPTSIDRHAGPATPHSPSAVSHTPPPKADRLTTSEGPSGLLQGQEKLLAGNKPSESKGLQHTPSGVYRNDPAVHQSYTGRLFGLVKLPVGVAASVVHKLGEFLSLRGKNQETMSVPTLNRTLQKLEGDHSENKRDLDTSKQVLKEVDSTAAAVEGTLAKIDIIHGQARTTMHLSNQLLEAASMSEIPLITKRLRELEEKQGLLTSDLTALKRELEGASHDGSVLKSKLEQVEKGDDETKIALENSKKVLPEASVNGAPLINRLQELDQQFVKHSAALDHAHYRIKKATVSGKALKGKLVQIGSQLEHIQGDSEEALNDLKQVHSELSKIDAALKGKVVPLQKELQASKNSHEKDKTNLTKENKSYKTDKKVIGGIGLVTTAASAAALYYEYDTSRKQSQIIANLQQQQQLAAGGPPPGSPQQGLTG